MGSSWQMPYVNGAFFLTFFMCRCVTGPRECLVGRRLRCGGACVEGRVWRGERGGPVGAWHAPSRPPRLAHPLPPLAFGAAVLTWDYWVVSNLELAKPHPRGFSSTTLFVIMSGAISLNALNYYWWGQMVRIALGRQSKPHGKAV